MDDASLLITLEQLAGLAWFEVDGERRLQRWSPAVERLTGYRADEVQGLPCVVGVRCEACLSECGVFEHGRVSAVPLTLHHKDGSLVEVSKSGRTLVDDEGRITGAIEVLQPRASVATSPSPSLCGDDQTDRLFQALGRYAILADESSRILRISPRLVDRLGLFPRELPGLRLADVVGEDLFGEQSAFRRAVLGGQRREGWAAVLRDSDGAAVPMSVSAGRVESLDGGPFQVFVVLRPEEAGGEDTDIPRFEGMVAKSAEMHRIFRLIDLLHDNDATVLITGESGTGKELVARALHARSHRSGGPFVAVNCGALPADLLESELFGHVRGAFTGALRDRPGRFEMAEGGTLFLDEIGDLPPQLQVKLLRVLQERTFERVGEGTPRTADVRVLAATNIDLHDAVARRRFRDDLFYRLRVVPIEIPPLRQRPQDLGLLIRFLLRRIGRERGRSLRLSPAATRVLLAYPWPGNVRELENALEYATAVCEGQTVHVQDLPTELGTGAWSGAVPSATAESLQAGPTRDWLLPGLPPSNVAAPPTRAPTEPVSAADGSPLSPVERSEASRILQALEQTGYRRADAAKLLGISRTTLWRKVKQYRIG